MIDSRALVHGASCAEDPPDDVAELVHDLRSPLTSILGFSRLLTRAEDFSPEQRELFAERINAESQRLSALVEDVIAVVVASGRLGAPTRFDTAG